MIKNKSCHVVSGYNPDENELTVQVKRWHHIRSIVIFAVSIFIMALFISLPAYAALGDFMYKWGGEYSYGYPSTIAIDSTGNTYVANSGGVHVFSSTGLFLRQLGTGRGSNECQFDSPQGIAIDAQGNVYVADFGNNRVQVFSKDGVFLIKWGTYGSADGQFVHPHGIAIDANGNVYVTDVDNHRVQVFSSTGAFLRKWGSFGSVDGQFWSPRGIAVDLSGNVYVTDGDNRRVQVFSNIGTFIRKWGTSGSGDGQFGFANGIAVDTIGNVFVSDAGNNRVQVFSNVGKFIRKWGTYGSGDGQFYSQYGIAVDGIGNVYVADTWNNRVQVFSNTGTFLRKWGSFDFGNGDGLFSFPMGIAVDISGNVYVADSSNYRIQVFSNTGTFLRKWGSYGSADGQFEYPNGVAVDSSGKVYVIDGGTRVLAFSNDGTFLRQWGSYGSADGQFRSPLGIAMDGNGNVYVADTYNHRIQVFSSEGVFLRKWGTLGKDDGQFLYPNGVAVDEMGNVYVADSNNYRIQIFSSAGTFIKTWQGNFHPMGIAVDGKGNVLVADTYNNLKTILYFNNTGSVIGKWGPPGSGDGQLLNPFGLTVDFNGKVFVADTTNNRIQVFDGRITDAQMPVTSYMINGSAGNNGWYVSDAGLSLTATDSDSGVKEIHYSIDGVEAIIAGSSASFTISTEGAHSITYYAVDNAGNIETAHSLIVKVDKTIPGVTASATPVPNANGWNNSVVTIAYTCNDATSGVANCQSPITVVSEGAGQVVSGIAEDYAGLTATATMTVNLDKTAPVITASVNPLPNANGWNNTDVTVTFTCSDALSGIVSCPAPIIVTAEGVGQVITGEAVDKAGNKATTSVILSIDKTLPKIAASVSPAPNANGWNNTDVTVTFTCSDTLFGIASCPSPITVTTEGAGQVISGTANDKAGNTATASVTLNIDKTAPMVTLSTNPGMLWPPNHKMVDVAVLGGMTDPTSDIASVVFTVVDEYGQVQPIVSGFNVTIPLEAWREGTDMDGRHYTISAVVTDKAGNQSTTSTVVLVPHDMR